MVEGISSSKGNMEDDDIGCDEEWRISAKRSRGS